MAEGGVDASQKEVDDENVVIPCEFCCQCFPISQIILHQSGCDGEPTKSTEPKRNDALLQRSKVATGREFAPRNENVEIIQDHTFRIKQHAAHETFDLRKTDDGYVLKKVAKAGDEKIHETAKKDYGYVLKKVAKAGDKKIHETAKKDDGYLLKTVTKLGDEKIHETAKKNSIEDESKKVPKQKEDDKIQQSGNVSVSKFSVNVNKNSIEDESKKVPKQKEDDKIQRSGNVSMSQFSANVNKNSEYSDYDDFSDLPDDNNPENETVEHFIWKALAKAENMRKAMHKSQEVGV